MARLTVTAQLASAAAMDAGNRSMRRARRTAWNAEDYNAACDEATRLAPLVPGWTPENPIDCMEDRRYGNRNVARDDGLRGARSRTS